MLGLAIVGTLVFIAVGAIVGCRLLSLARRTRELPETTLGLGLLLIVGIGYPLTLSAPRIGVDGALGPGLAALGITVMAIGWSAVSIFTWRVFRPESKTAAAGAFAMIAFLVAAAAWRCESIFAATTALELEQLGPATILFQFVAAAVFFWAGSEAFVQWRMALRRRSLGIGDPVVTNRFFLFFLIKFFSLLSLVGPIIGSTAGIPAHENPAILLSVTLSGLACSASLLLAFLPPKAYLEWIAGDVDLADRDVSVAQ